MKNNLTVRIVVAAALRRGDGLWLMQRRSMSAEHGGLWEFPGGKVEPGETPEVALVRELEEELGIRVASQDLSPVAFASGKTGRGATIVILLYEAARWTGEAHCRLGEEIAWFSLADIGGLAMPPLDYPLWRALVRHPACQA